MAERLRGRWLVALMAGAGAVLLAGGLAGVFGFAVHSAASLPAPASVSAPRPVASHTEPRRGAGHLAGGVGQLAGYPGTPEAVAIPGLRVRASIVERVAVQAKGPERGLLTAPPDPLQVGWYRYRDDGALLVVGHVGNASTAGALAYIGSLASGSSFSVVYAGGTRMYRVVSVVHVRKGQLSRSLFSAAANGEVVLITCDYQSPFNKGHFADNVYVVGLPA